MHDYQRFDIYALGLTDRYIGVHRRTHVQVRRHVIVCEAVTRAFGWVPKRDVSVRSLAPVW